MKNNCVKIDKNKALTRWASGSYKLINRSKEPQIGISVENLVARKEYSVHFALPSNIEDDERNTEDEEK